MKVFLLGIVIFYGISSIKTQGQISAPKFQFFNQKQGFHGDKVRAMLQDKNGFIWIGTNEGVFIYNGESFEQIISTDQKAQEIIGGIIQKIVQDKNGNIWIGSNKGLAVYLAKFQQFKFISMLDSKLYITGITETADEHIWVSSDIGVYQINPQNWEVKKIYTSEAIPSMSHVLTCDQSLYLISNNKIYTINYLNQKIISVYTYNTKPSISENISTSVVSDQKNMLWIGKYNGMIYSFNKHTLSIDSIDTKKATNNSSAIVNQLYYAPYQKKLIACIDESGVFELFNKQLVNYFQSYQLLPTKKITGLLIDRENNTWISMEKNGLAMSNTSFNFFSNFEVKNIAKSSIVSALYKDSKGNLWIGTDGGGLIVKNKSIKTYVHQPNNSNSISNDAILAITEDQQGYIWIGSFRGGLSQYNPKTNGFVNYTTHNSNISGNDVRKIIIDDEGKLWLVIHGKGISMFDPTKKIFENYTSPQSLWTYDLIIDKKKQKWIASNEGVSILNQKKQFEHISTTQFGFDIHTLCEDQQNRIWIGTVKGLYYINKLNNQLAQLPIQTILNNISITWIKQIGLYTLLIGSSKGMFLLNTKTFETQFYNSDAGLPSDELIVNAVFNDTYKNQIYVGTSNGYFTFNYLSLPQFKLNKAPIIQYLFVNDEPQMIEKNISLSYNKNNISLTLAYPYYTINRTDFEYEYIIEGLDKYWKQSKSAQLNFRSLPYGEYKIKIRSITQSNRSQHSPEVELNIRISPPFWETLWFKISMFVLLLVFIYFYYRQKTKNILEQNKLLESKIEERTALLKNQKELLLIKQEELETSNLTKEKLFSIIAHDLRAPFSSILGLTQILKEQFNKTTPEEYLKYLNVMQHSSEQAFQMLDNLLEWAKAHMHSITYTPTWYNLYQLSSEVLTLITNRAKEKNIELSIEGDKNLFVYSDKEILKTILRNLVNNAIKYTNNNGSIQICFKSVSTEKIEVVVKDNGVGIEADKINELFYNHQIATSKQGTSGEKGTGIGLWICKELLPVLKSSWEIVSTPTIGTEITLILDSKHEQRISTIEAFNLDGSIKEVRLPNNISFPIQKNKTILIVEDDVAILETLKVTLSPYFQIQSANNGIEALSYLEHNDADLILSDIMMPEMDGITFSIHCKENEQASTIPIILLTSQNEELTIIKGLQTGVDDYLIKPIASEILLLKISNLLQQRDLLKKKFTLSNQEILNEMSEQSLDKKFVEKILQVIDQKLSDERFGVEELSKEMAMHRSSLAKKTTLLLKINPLELIKTQRLKKSAQLLITSGLNVSEIAYEVGFTDPKYFSKMFKAYYGMNPSEYAASYKNKE